MQTLYCIGCGEKILGQSWWCEGCNGYYCYNDGLLNPVSEGGGAKYLCSNCSTELKAVNM